MRHWQVHCSEFCAKVFLTYVQQLVHTQQKITTHLPSERNPVRVCSNYSRGTRTLFKNHRPITRNPKRMERLEFPTMTISLDTLVTNIPKRNFYVHCCKPSRRHRRISYVTLCSNPDCLPHTFWNEYVYPMIWRTRTQPPRHCACSDLRVGLLTSQR